MSSLQKFHRRTNNAPAVPATWPATAIGMGDSTHGYWVGTAGDGTSKLIIAPKSTETNAQWCNVNTIVRGAAARSNTDGITNTNTLYAFGQSAHPAAYAAKTLSLGGYNTWYLPAKDELTNAYANRAATPFATANTFVFGSPNTYWSSTEYAGSYSNQRAWGMTSSGTGDYSQGKISSQRVRAVRRIA